MENSGYVALSRQTALRRQMEVIAHNLANANTNGFQGSSTLFREYLTREESGARLSFNRKVAFVQDIGDVRNTATGALRATGGQLDLAIQGEGYFTIETPLGPRYTRNGAFQLNADGQITTALGQRLLDSGGDPLQLPDGAEAVKVSPNGVVEARLPANGDIPVFQPIGTIEIVTFENQQEMKQIESGLLTGAGEEIALEDSKVLQGMIEGSNVNPVSEMVKMIGLQRGFNRGQEMLTQEHERMRRAYRTLTQTS